MPHHPNFHLAGRFDPTTSDSAPSDRSAVSDRGGLGARIAIVRTVRACVGHAAGRLGAAVEAIRRPARGEDVLHRFADFLGEPRTASEIESTLVRLARELSGAERVQLVCDPSCSDPRDVGQAGERGDRDDEAPSSPSSPAPPLRIPVRCGGHVLGSLHVFLSRSRPASAALVRRLNTLCAMATSARINLRTDRSKDDMFRDAPFLRAFLPYALAQARRRHEPLTLFYVSVDRLAAIRELHGPEIAAAAVDRVAEMTVLALRTSDVVARLDDGRLIAVLPCSDHEDAPAVAEAVRAAIASKGAATRTMPLLTASIGVASFPHNALDLVSLNLAASAALTHARGLGRDRVVQSKEKAETPALAIAR
jgi:diguanylate cyclase (GGDEF)-like protein